MKVEKSRLIDDEVFQENDQVSKTKLPSETELCNRSNEVHLIFFHGMGDFHKIATCFLETDLPASIDIDTDSFYAHAHKYPIAFQCYLIFFVASFLFLIASVIVPLIMVIRSPSVKMVGLATLAALTCIILSELLLVIPFLNKDQSLFKSSIEKIDQLIDEGVKPENIILFGHSFGGVAGSAVLKHFADKGVTLGDAFFNSTFSSFEVAIKNFPLPQTQILSMLPPSLFEKLLKALNLNFDVAKNIIELQNKGLGTRIVVANNKGDELIPQAAQLIHAMIKDNHQPSSSIITISAEGDHNDFSRAFYRQLEISISVK